MVKGQLGVIIYIKFVELEYIMFHTKFHDHRTISSVGENVIIRTNYDGPVYQMPHTNSGGNLSTGSKEEDDFKGFYHI